MAGPGILAVGEAGEVGEIDFRSALQDPVVRFHLALEKYCGAAIVVSYSKLGATVRSVTEEHVEIFGIEIKAARSITVADRMGIGFKFEARPFSNVPGCLIAQDKFELGY